MPFDVGLTGDERDIVEVVNLRNMSTRALCLRKKQKNVSPIFGERRGGCYFYKKIESRLFVE